MTDKQLAQLERELAELDVLLGEVDTTAEKERTVPVEEALNLLEVLDTELRPFLIRYTALLNRSKQFIPIEPSKLERFIPLAEEVSNCVEIGIAIYGTIYLSVIDMMINGINCKQEHVNEIDDLITFLFYDIQLTDDFKGAKSLFTYIKRDNGIEQFVPVITVEGEEG
jgi:hypothetical protein